MPHPIFIRFIQQHITALQNFVIILTEFGSYQKAHSHTRLAPTKVLALWSWSGLKRARRQINFLTTLLMTYLHGGLFLLAWRMTQFNELPPNLPRPVDDGAANHLKGMRLPSLSLQATNGKTVDLSKISGLVVVYAYPMTGRPDVPLPESWDDIPGARGCTPQCCAFRDHYGALEEMGVELFGLSVQTTDYQQEMAARLHLPFQVLSDSQYAFTKALNLPTFEVAGMVLLKRLTLIVKDTAIIAVHYPIFPSDSDAPWVLNYLQAGPSGH